MFSGCKFSQAGAFGSVDVNSGAAMVAGSRVELVASAADTSIEDCILDIDVLLSLEGDDEK